MKINEYGFLATVKTQIPRLRGPTDDRKWYRSDFSIISFNNQNALFIYLKNIDLSKVLNIGVSVERHGDRLAFASAQNVYHLTELADIRFESAKSIVDNRKRESEFMKATSESHLLAYGKKLTQTQKVKDLLIGGLVRSIELHKNKRFSGPHGGYNYWHPNNDKFYFNSAPAAIRAARPKFNKTTRKELLVKYVYDKELDYYED